MRILFLGQDHERVLFRVRGRGGAGQTDRVVVALRAVQQWRIVRRAAAYGANVHLSWLMTTKCLLWLLVVLDCTPQSLAMSAEACVFPLESSLGFGEAFPFPAPFSTRPIDVVVVAPHIACSRGEITHSSLLDIVSDLMRWVVLWQT